MYCVDIVLSQQVRSKSKKVTIVDNFDHFNRIKKCLDSVYNLDMWLFYLLVLISIKNVWFKLFICEILKRKWEKWRFLGIFHSKMVENLWKQHSIRVRSGFLVISKHLGKHKIVFKNWEKYDEVGLTPPGQPVFWVSQLFPKFKRRLKKFHLTFFPKFFCIDTWARMLFPISNNRYMDVLRNKWVIKWKWTKSESQKHVFWHSE